jgi:hypothetical protein
MKALTIQQAEAEARWRWGSILERGFARHSSALKKPFEVGTKLFGTIKIRGQGNSWEAAFGNADTQTNDKKPRE